MKGVTDGFLIYYPFYAFFSTSAKKDSIFLKLWEEGEK